jgi:uncharacterized protein YqgQ
MHHHNRIREEKMTDDNDDMREEYDFGGAVHGKYYEQYNESVIDKLIEQRVRLYDALNYAENKVDTQEILTRIADINEQIRIRMDSLGKDIAEASKDVRNEVISEMRKEVQRLDDYVMIHRKNYEKAISILREHSYSQSVFDETNPEEVLNRSLLCVLAYDMSDVIKRAKIYLLMRGLKYPINSITSNKLSRKEE